MLAIGFVAAVFAPPVVRTKGVDFIGDYVAPPVEGAPAVPPRAIYRRGAEVCLAVTLPGSKATRGGSWPSRPAIIGLVRIVDRRIPAPAPVAGVANAHAAGRPACATQGRL